MKKIIPLSIVGLSSLAILAIPSALVNIETIKLNNNNDIQNNFKEQESIKNIPTTTSKILTQEIVQSLGWHEKQYITLSDWKAQAPNVEEISWGFAFANSILVSIEIPASIKIIGQSSFQQNLHLTSITFEPGSLLKSIETIAFLNTGIIENFIIPKQLENIGDMAFAHSNLKRFTFEPDSTLKSIGDNVFDNSQIESVKIPKSVMHIGKEAFKNTAKLVDISMPVHFKDKGMQYFGFTQTQWNSIEWIYTPFLGTELDAIEISKLDWDKKSVITLSDWENFAPNVTVISGAFWNNEVLTSIEIPNKVELIGDNTFNGAINLNKVTFEPGSKLSAIGLNAFSNTTKLKDIILPYHLKTELPNFGFTQEQWSKISWSNPPVNPEPEQPDEITSLTKEVAYQIGWTNKEVITLEDWNKYIPNVVSIEDGIWQNNQIIKSIVIPSHIKILSNDLFENSSLESIYFTEDSQLHVISTRAFQGSNITKIKVPLSVEIIEENAFASTSMLGEIIIDGKFKQNYSFIGISDSQLENIKWIKMNSSTSIIVASVISAVVLISILGVVVYVFKVKKNKNNDVTSEASV